MGSINLHHPDTLGGIIHSAHFKQATLSYVQTGELPNTTFFLKVEQRFEANPTNFLRYHPQYSGFFTKPECLGLLPTNNSIFNQMRHRYQINPIRFTHYHKFYGHLLANEKYAQEHCAMLPTAVSPEFISPEMNVPSVEVPITPAVPAPSSLTLGVLMLPCLLFYRLFLSKKPILYSRKTAEE